MRCKGIKVPTGDVSINGKELQLEGAYEKHANRYIFTTRAQQKLRRCWELNTTQP
jgi:hypothetical protein